MSHIVTIQVEVKDFDAIKSACRRRNLKEPVHGKAEIFQTQIEGVIVELPEWIYPVACILHTGELKYDNFNQQWGDQKYLDQFVQTYCIEKTTREARRKGHCVVERQIAHGKIRRAFLVALAPIVLIPAELEKLFQVLEHPLPDKEQLREIATEIVGQLPDDVTTHRVLNAAAGMTRLEAEGAFSLSMIEHDTLLPEPIWDSFVVCAANDISKLPPERCRAERFDGIFFVDLPDVIARNQIWNVYENEYRLENQKRPEDTDWTGAEIKACCRLSKLLDVSLMEAAMNVVPVAQTASESINALRTWASGRCLDATKPGVYRYGNSTRRNISRNDNLPSTTVA